MLRLGVRVALAAQWAAAAACHAGQLPIGRPHRTVPLVAGAAGPRQTPPAGSLPSHGRTRSHRPAEHHFRALGPGHWHLSCLSGLMPPGWATVAVAVTPAAAPACIIIRPNSIRWTGHAATSNFQASHLSSEIGTASRRHLL